MMPISPTNRLIERLPRKERKRLLDACATVDLTLGSTLYTPNVAIPFVWFPLAGLISLESKVNDHPPMEVGLSGNEGMLGATLVIGINAAPVRAVVQVSGIALRLTATDFLALLKECPALKRTAQRYLHVRMILASRATPCTRFHGIDARLASCLLMIDDRTHGDYFDLTHKSLANMLGVQRSAITLAASAMQTDGLIRYSRGRICVISRTDLKTVACDCYDKSIRDYSRQFPA